MIINKTNFIQQLLIILRCMIGIGTIPMLSIITVVYRAQTIKATSYRIVWLVQEAVHQEAIKADAQEEVMLAGVQ